LPKIVPFVFDTLYISGIVYFLGVIYLEICNFGVDYLDTLALAEKGSFLFFFSEREELGFKVKVSSSVWILAEISISFNYSGLR
jgi:hypothetical protein